MAQKRRNGDNVLDEMSGREKKKLKVTEARTIAVQPVVDQSLQGVSGPSAPKATTAVKNSKSFPPYQTSY